MIPLCLRPGHHITFDCAQNYKTPYNWIAGAIKGLPARNFSSSQKCPANPSRSSKTIDRHRKVFDTDYVDSMLNHCWSKTTGTDQMERINGRL